MKYGSVCSGIEAATVAWHGIGATMCLTCEGLGRYNGHPCGPCGGRGYVGGWTPTWFSEIEKFPSAVLAHHYPGVPNLGDMTKFSEWHNDPINGPGAIDLLVGGTPCQSFSVAGLRKGLADPRGNLMLTFGAITSRYRPRWLVWENVPGVLSSNGGRDFGSFLGMLGQCGYGFAYRVFDAQYFGVAQQRKRVFVVANSGGWQRAAAVLFEREAIVGSDQDKLSQRRGRSLTPLLALAMSESERREAQSGYQIRFLTPKEQERLQGFPDNYTLIEGATPQKRWKALGNSMAVPVMAWIGQRIEQVEDIINKEK